MHPPVEFNSPKNLPAAAGEPPRRSCFALDGYSRFSGDLALRHSAGMRLAHALRMVVDEIFNQKISLRRRGSRLAARASHSAVTVDFPETSLCGIPQLALCSCLENGSLLILLESKNLPAAAGEPPRRDNGAAKHLAFFEKG